MPSPKRDMKDRGSRDIQKASREHHNAGRPVRGSDAIRPREDIVKAGRAAGRGDSKEKSRRRDGGGHSNGNGVGGGRGRWGREFDARGHGASDVKGVGVEGGRGGKGGRGGRGFDGRGISVRGGASGRGGRGIGRGGGERKGSDPRHQGSGDMGGFSRIKLKHPVVER